jgi:enamine deaminase RidA (YjgF/YER057c/UK114 family)
VHSHAQLFGDNRPARSTVEIPCVPSPEALVEIEAIALIPIPSHV